VTITPDGKDWTWVLARTCSECDFTAADVPTAEVAGQVRATAADWVRVLDGSGVLGGCVAQRPSPAVWSPLEYACHVRDVLRLQDERLVLVLTTDDPVFPDWDQDVAAVQGRYGEQDPARVAADLLAAAAVVADRLDSVTGWTRPGRRSDGAVFTVHSFAQYFLHDVVHHLHDVRPVRT
jgi:hypothetical protein